MPATLLDSQFAVLEEPEGALRVDGTLPVDEIAAAVTALARPAR
jgi:gluconate kinase